MAAFENSTIQPNISIHFLGGFQLIVDGCVISQSLNQKKQLKNLLAYLLVFHNNTISQEAMINALWPDGYSESPANALKNLVYRLRKILSSYPIACAKNLIIYDQGAYCWNKKYQGEVDIEEFQKFKKWADDTSRPLQERVDAYCDAIRIYKGDFLPSLCYEEWVVPFANFYHSEYLKCVHAVCALLLKLERYDTVVSVCEQAAIIEPLDEEVHKYQIFCLAKQNKHQRALEHYRYVRDLFYRELGVKPSKTMRALYHQIAKSIQSVETDLDTIKQSLNEKKSVDGAFYCDYEVFRSLYQLEVRAASRIGRSVFLCLLTVTSRDGILTNHPQLHAVMTELLNTVQSSLRKGDVFSKFSSTQYVLMLPTLTYENGRMVMERICKRFYDTTQFETVKILTDLRPLDAMIE